VYSKWWFVEVFMEDELLRLAGGDLGLERTFNLPRQAPQDRTAFLNAFAVALIDDALATARKDILTRYPVVLHEDNGLRLDLAGPDVDRYVPKPNAQGDPAYSVPVFLKEIIRTKACKNGLDKHHPNLLMANGLGTDFQLSFDSIKRAHFDGLNFKPIDALFVASCGIDSQLSDCVRR
jgi:hypothetical protein